MHERTLVLAHDDAPQRTGGSEPRIASWTWHAGVLDSSGRLTVNPKCGGTTYADT